MRPLPEIIFELQNMHFGPGIFCDFRWNVKKFGPALQKFLDQAYEEGRQAGRAELSAKVGKALSPK